MSVRVMTWVWESSRSKKNARLLLLAIADCARDDGTNAFPSVAELVRKTGLSERGVQSTIADLVELGELKVRRNAGPGGCNRYQVVMATPAVPAPAKSAPPAGTAGAGSAPPQETTPTPAEPAPGTVLEPSEKKISSSKRSTSARKPKAEPEPNPAEESAGQRVNRLARVYTDRVKLSNFNAIAGVVRKAVTAGVSDRAITHGLNVLADDLRSVTVDSLRYAIHGVPPSQFRQQAGPKPSTTDAKFAQHQALKEQFRDPERIALP